MGVSVVSWLVYTRTRNWMSESNGTNMRRFWGWVIKQATKLDWTTNWTFKYLILCVLKGFVLDLLLELWIELFVALKVYFFPWTLNKKIQGCKGVSKSRTIIKLKSDEYCNNDDCSIYEGIITNNYNLK